jgi:pantetheine-phosphate adenylyltransferase
VVLDERRYGDTKITRFAEAAAGPAGRAGGSMRGRDARCIGLFAASFDPVTNGPLDLHARARRVFDEVVVAVGRNIAKEGTFSVEERLEILEALLGSEPGVRITSFEGLVVDYAREIGATALIRGLRAMSDFEYEFEMALMNKHLNPDLETLFMMTDQKYLYVSSSRLKELVRFGTSIEDFVPAVVAKKLREKAGGP